MQGIGRLVGGGLWRVGGPMTSVGGPMTSVGGPMTSVGGLHDKLLNGFLLVLLEEWKPVGVRAVCEHQLHGLTVPDVDQNRSDEVRRHFFR
jgi:hypothetical protein